MPPGTLALSDKWEKKYSENEDVWRNAALEEEKRRKFDVSVTGRTGAGKGAVINHISNDLVGHDEWGC